MVRRAQEQGRPVESLPSREQYEQITKVVAGDLPGGAAAIVAELGR